MSQLHSRTHKVLRAHGWLTETTQRWNAHMRTRHDLFGFADITAVHPDHCGTLYVQVTDSSHGAEHLDDLIRNPNVLTCLKAGNMVQCWAWNKYKSHRNRWLPKVYRATVTDEGGVEFDTGAVRTELK